MARSNFFATFVAAAPGAAELVATTKAWELAQTERWNKKLEGYDLVILDGPASGHAVGMLRTPGTFADIARVGPIATQSRKVREWLGDGRRTGYVAVALPAELPVSETLELGGRLDRALGRELDAVIANGVLPDRFTEAELDAVSSAGAGPEVADALLGAERRATLQGEHLERLRADAGVPVRELPFLFTRRVERHHVEELADRLSVP